MDPRTFAVGALLVASAATLPSPALAGCEAQSGPNTAALVELYTSEGCSSCPPADRQLSHLQQALDPAAVAVPLSLHVDYWDYIGWSDPYAQAEFAKRQRWLVQANHEGVVYTPHFFVSGSELRPWQTALRDAVRNLNAKPAQAQIRIEANLTRNDSLVLAADATARGAGDHARAVSRRCRRRPRVQGDPRRKWWCDSRTRSRRSRVDRSNSSCSRRGPHASRDCLTRVLGSRSAGNRGICRGRSVRQGSASRGDATVFPFVRLASLRSVLISVGRI